MTPHAQPTALALRLWRYQSERFPLGRHGVLIFLLASSALYGSMLLRGIEPSLAAGRLPTAFFLLLAAFVHLRIADEFKDADIDARFRPHRPVPRGLVSLNELAAVALLAALGQAVAVLLLAPALFALLLAVWVYMGLMTAEFCAPHWLRRHPGAYLLSHMAIMPLLVALAAACDWLADGAPPPQGLGVWLALGFANGLVLELGRKTWSPEMERHGVESYSATWGIGWASALWLAAAGAGVVCTLGADLLLGGGGWTAALPALVWGVMAVTARRFSRNPAARLAGRMETLSGLFILANLIMTGVVPMGVHLWK
jgi:4-hydroxybenzoate polyprenyltransferase